MRTSVKAFRKIDGNKTLYSTNGSKPKSRVRVEQDVDLVLKNMKLKIQGQSFDELLLTTVRRYKHFKANEDRMNLGDGLLFRKCYGKAGNVKYYKVLSPKNLIDEVLRRIWKRHWN